MAQVDFSFQDLVRDCQVQTGIYQLDGKALGAKLWVPDELLNQHPYNVSGYDFLQQLRSSIFEYGLIEFPNLPLNKKNHTLAQRAPQQHAYSANTYMTDFCQSPHQDTPPYPTAFWLAKPRQYFATWVMSLQGVERFYHYQQAHPSLSIDEIHQRLVPESLANHTGLLLNQAPGLLLIDNSDRQSLYHARTCNFSAQVKHPNFDTDNPMYAYNEVGLLNYIDILDSRRGQSDRDAQQLESVRQFMLDEGLS